MTTDPIRARITKPNEPTQEETESRTPSRSGICTCRYPETWDDPIERDEEWTR